MSQQESHALSVDSSNISKMKQKNNNNGEEERKKIHQKVSLLKLFSFADSYDYLLMILGSIGACLHGASVPVFFIFFGKMINIAGLAYLFPAQTSHKVAKYSLDFVYLSVVILFSSWIGLSLLPNYVARTL
uniref:p-glycoprotein n=1 Tax=Solanum tuberosum TaxID=4113 RepID=M1BH79_SOLTU